MQSEEQKTTVLSLHSDALHYWQSWYFLVMSLKGNVVVKAGSEQ